MGLLLPTADFCRGRPGPTGNAGCETTWETCPPGQGAHAALCLEKAAEWRGSLQASSDPSSFSAWLPHQSDPKHGDLRPLSLHLNSGCEAVKSNLSSSPEAGGGKRLNKERAERTRDTVMWEGKSWTATPHPPNTHTVPFVRRDRYASFKFGSAVFLIG